MISFTLSWLQQAQKLKIAHRLEECRFHVLFLNFVLLLPVFENTRARVEPVRNVDHRAHLREELKRDAHRRKVFIRAVRVRQRHFLVPRSQSLPQKKLRRLLCV
jgi:hypothetical protein